MIFFWSNRKRIPVLLGSHYRDIFKQGDIFEANYLYSDFIFEVIGFLEENSKIDISIFSVSLDDYIIMPSLFFSSYPKSETEFTTQKIHYANKTSGILCLESDDFNYIHLELLGILSKSKDGEYSMYSSCSEKSYLLNGIDLKKILHIIYVVFPILFFLSAFLSYKWIHYTKKIQAPLK